MATPVRVDPEFADHEIPSQVASYDDPHAPLPRSKVSHAPVVVMAVAALCGGAAAIVVTTHAPEDAPTVSWARPATLWIMRGVSGLACLSSACALLGAPSWHMHFELPLSADREAIARSGVLFDHLHQLLFHTLALLVSEFGDTPARKIAIGMYARAPWPRVCASSSPPCRLAGTARKRTCVNATSHATACDQRSCVPLDESACAMRVRVTRCTLGDWLPCCASVGRSIWATVRPRARARRRTFVRFAVSPFALFLFLTLPRLPAYDACTLRLSMAGASLMAVASAAAAGLSFFIER